MTDRQRKSINHNNEVIDCRVQNFRIGTVGMKKRQRNPSLIIYVDPNCYGPVLWIQILYIEFGS